MWKRSSRWVTGLLIVSLVFLAACGNADQDGDQEIVVSSFGGKYDEVFTKYIKEPFEEQNPGVTVKLAPYTSVTKLSQGGGGTIDVVQLDDFDLIDAGNQGLLAPLSEGDFSTWDQLYAQAYLQGSNEQTYGLTNVFGAWGIAYNPNEVEAPTSWNDLWSDPVKEKVAMMSQWIPDMLLTQQSTGASIEQMEPVWQAYQEISPSITQYYSSFSAPEALFNSNSIVMASWFDGRALAMKNEGKPVDFVIPEEGGILIRSGMGIVESSDKQDIAKKLIDFAMTEDVQQGFANELYYGPTNSTVTLEQDLQDTVVYGKEKVDALITPDWNTILPKREEWFTKWTEATTQ